MATQEIEITSTPKDVIADLSLVVGTSYEVRNAGNGDSYGGRPVLTIEADAALTEIEVKAKKGILTLMPPRFIGSASESDAGGAGLLKPETDGKLYAWTRKGSAWLAVNEA